MTEPADLIERLRGHTPGPWSIVKRPDGTMVILTRDDNGNPRKHIAEMAWADSEDGEPDALLISAAPELLDMIAHLLAERDELREQLHQTVDTLAGVENDEARLLAAGDAMAVIFGRISGGLVVDVDEIEAAAAQWRTVKGEGV